MAGGDSLLASPSMLQQTPAAAPMAFRVLLRDIKRYDTFEIRELDLPLNSTFPIGRASKNAAKPELLPASSNAYIDSPVISREHAVLSANMASGTPRVYITDSGSMHGTMVNGRRLVPNAPEPLMSGDVLQFGIDVNRNDEFFVARKYEVEAHPATPYSLGFAVPDPESEDEVDFAERRGSEQHPLTIDDSDSASEVSVDEQPEVTLAAEAAPKLDPLPVPTFTPQFPQDRPSSPTQDSLVELVEKNGLGEEDDDPLYTSISGSDVDDIELDTDSEAGSAASSEAEYGSEQEVPDSEDEMYIPPSPLSPSRPMVSGVLPVQPMQMQMPPTVQPRHVYSLDEMTNSQAPGLPPLGMFHQNYSNPAATFAATMTSPLPPRPSAPRQPPWQFTSYIQQNDSPAWYSDQMSYLGTNFGDRPSLFSPPPPPPPPPQAQETASQARAFCQLFSGAVDAFQPENRLQTPPPAPAPEVTTVTPPPNRRTKVFSIEEIVEDQPQPPTPTSLNGMKRKADALEEEEISPAAASTPTPEEANEAVAVAAETAAIIARRPKKQPRSIMGKVFKGATYPLLGAAGAVVSFTLLSTLPDAFFGA